VASDIATIAAFTVLPNIKTPEKAIKTPMKTYWFCSSVRVMLSHPMLTAYCDDVH
jgi:hypothetical protein